MKHWQWALIFAALAVILAAVWWVWPEDGTIVGIYRDGVLVETVDLTKERVIELGTAVAVVEDGEIYMAASDCPDQICVAHGPLRHGGTPIVCLPNHLSIQWIKDTAEVNAVSGGR